MTELTLPARETSSAGIPIPALEADLPRLVVLGLGNRIQGDEALGALVIEQLGRDGSVLATLPEPAAVGLLDGGTVGLALLPYLCELDGLVVVDIVDADEAPGTLVDLDGADVLRHDPAMGVHDLGAEEILGALFVMGQLPRHTRVVGLQPERIGLGLELTPTLQAGFPDLVARVVAHLRSWQEAGPVVTPD